MMPPSHFRGFIAVKIPEDVERAIERYQESCKKEGFHCKWVKPSNIHITLKFLGDVEDSLVPGLVELLDGSLKGQKTFRVSVNSVGVFPNLESPRIFWAGIEEGSEEIRKVQGVVEDAASRLGFERETRSFKPHLTIGRFKARFDPRKLKRAIEKGDRKQFGLCDVDRVVLVRSDLKPTGPVYSEVSQIIF